MITERRIQIGEYIFLITIQSKSEHAHSLMTDKKYYFGGWLGYLVEKLNESLPLLVEDHKKGKG